MLADSRTFITYGPILIARPIEPSTGQHFTSCLLGLGGPFGAGFVGFAPVWYQDGENHTARCNCQMRLKGTPKIVESRNPHHAQTSDASYI